MNKILEQEFNELLSSGRLSSYRFNADDTFEILLDRYIYNIKISETFYPILSILEVFLRNKLHKAVANEFKNKDWLLAECEKQHILKNKERNLLLKARQKFSKHVKEDNLIAELSLGFWIKILFSISDKCTKLIEISRFEAIERQKPRQLR